jgi:cellulose synthase operon protein C
MWLLPPALVLVQSDTAELAKLLADAPKAADYPNAAKATLLDLADITVRPDGSAKIVTHQAIKVLSPRGREQEAEIKIPYNGSYETVKLIRARTLRPNGTVVEVKPTDVRNGAASEGYDDAKVLSFSMPAVEPGCLIDYEYVTEQKTSPLPGNFWFQWYFQGGFDPVQLTRLRITVPSTLNLARKLRNSAIEPTIRTARDGKSTTYTWEEKNVAPLSIEPLMPPAERQLPKLTVSTVPSWQSVADWYTKLAKDATLPDSAVVALARELTKSCRTDEEKARAIFYYVQDKTRYVAIELGISAYQPRPAGRTLTVQYGDCKDMATLLVALLRAAGITAHPVLLQANEPFPQQTELPSPHAFNHAICQTQIGGKTYWLDATAQVCRFGDIPQADRGVEALVIKDGKGVFETIPEATPSDATNLQQATVTLDSEGVATGTITLSGTGDYELGLRANLQVKSGDETKKYVEALLASIGVNPRIESLQVSEVANRDTPLTISSKAQFPAWATVSGDLLLFKARPDQSSPAYASPFTEEGRLYPIYQAEPRLVRSTLVATLPPGYSYLYVPKSVSEESARGRYKRTVQQDGRTLTIAIEVEDLRVSVAPREYPALRKYIDRYLRMYGELVIARKDAAAQVIE